MCKVLSAKTYLQFLGHRTQPYLGADHVWCLLLLLNYLGDYKEKKMTKLNVFWFPLTHRDFFRAILHDKGKQIHYFLALNFSLSFLESSPLHLDGARFLWCHVLSSPHPWLIVILQVQLHPAVLPLPWFWVSLQVLFSQFVIIKWRPQKFWSPQFFLKRKSSFQDGCVTRDWESLLW